MENSGPKPVTMSWKVYMVKEDSKGPFYKFRIRGNSRHQVSQEGTESRYKVEWQSIEPENKGEEVWFGVEP